METDADIVYILTAFGAATVGSLIFMHRQRVSLDTTSPRARLDRVRDLHASHWRERAGRGPFRRLVRLATCAPGAPGNLAETRSRSTTTHSRNDRSVEWQ